MKVLNLYAGLGGNRLHWKDVEVTAVEMQEDIAANYQERFPEDKVIIGDAHDYLLHHHQGFDFIWSSPPCQSHSSMVKATKHDLRIYPEMDLYQEIVFLQKFSSAKWVVENVVPYYEPLIKPNFKIGRHLFWSSFPISYSGIGDVKNLETPKGFIDSDNKAGAEKLKKWLGLDYEGTLYYKGNHCPAQVLRNCVHPDIGKFIFQESKRSGLFSFD